MNSNFNKTEIDFLINDLKKISSSTNYIQKPNTNIFPDIQTLFSPKNNFDNNSIQSFKSKITKKSFKPQNDLSFYLFNNENEVILKENSNKSFGSSQSTSFEKEKKIIKKNEPSIEEIYDEIMNKHLIQKYIINLDIESLKEKINLFQNNKDLLKKILSHIDERGNTPVLLTVLLHNHVNEMKFYRSKKLIDILKILLENGADFKLKNTYHYTPLDIAIFNKDRLMASIIYDYYLERYNFKYKRWGDEFVKYFRNMKDFSFVLKWKINIPLLNFLCPNDKCPVWKKGVNLRMDTTFKDFKNLKVIRNPFSYLMISEENDKVGFYKKDIIKNTFWLQNESLDEEEKKLIINELMLNKRMVGNFKLLRCEMSECLGFFSNKPIIEKVNGFDAQKYELNLTIKAEQYPIKLIEYHKINEKNYFDNKENIIKIEKNISEKELKDKFKDTLHVKNEQFTKSLSELEKEKKLKAYIWIANNTIFNSKDCINLIKILSPINDLMNKVNEFFLHPDVNKIVEKNGFPIKIQIPYNFFIDFTVSFDKFKTYENNDKELIDAFDILKDAKKITRKEADNLKGDYKKRVKYSNIR
jgi:hypothetical protein